MSVKTAIYWRQSQARKLHRTSSRIDPQMNFGCMHFNNRLPDSHDDKFIGTGTLEDEQIARTMELVKEVYPGMYFQHIGPLDIMTKFSLSETAFML